MPRVSDAKEKLTDAALALIWESSYGATSVDDICAKANVKKGSFYHFFKSKADLEIAALEANWQRVKQRWNDLFSPTVPPLQRLEDYFEYVLQRQTQLKEECGLVLGCPLCSVGSEVTTQEAGIREKALEIMGRFVKYLESAIRDAHAQGLVDAPDPKIKARMVYAYVQGTLAHARIANSLEPLRELKAGAWGLLGVRQSEPVAA
ncbi:MAG: TetR/AcrR family transcriptional regulator, transcriptional repressor for nem operon [Chthoniobacter sp.]|jgi:TetR/AcrR family transcriptional repressor of nem operon|nr:TetR/AcrR family transcriptional regulator, transcriptional repressor for nem operon [Chthoniobacter sp.]